jgi:hypothetical protein
MKNLEEKARQRNDELEYKQLKNESKRLEFEETRQMKFSIKKQEAIKKGDQIFHVLEKNKDLEQKKVKDYFERQAVVSLRKEELEELQMEEKMLKERKIEERQKRIDDVKINE